MTDPIAQWGQTIVLRPVRTRLAMGFACTVHDYAGRHVADLRAVIKGWQRLDRFFGYRTPICGYDLNVLPISESAPILTLRRVRQRGWRERPERYEIRRNGVVVRCPAAPEIRRLLQRRGIRGARVGWTRHRTHQERRDHA